MQRKLSSRLRWSAAAVLAARLIVATCLAGPACETDQAMQPARGLQPAGKALPHVADALRDGKRLDVLAVGSATMLGPRMTVAASFPARTVQMLHEARPATDIRLVVRAERGASAVELLAILRREIAAHPTSLVLWQTGTAEAARGRPLAEFEATLREGVRTALNAGSDIVLIDPPFSRLLRSRADPERYSGAFLDAAASPGAAVFSRYDLTRRWVESGDLDLERAASSDRGTTLTRLHECLAHALSRALLEAAAASASSADAQ